MVLLNLKILSSAQFSTTKTLSVIITESSFLLAHLDRDDSILYKSDENEKLHL